MHGRKKYSVSVKEQEPYETSYEGAWSVPLKRVHYSFKQFDDDSIDKLRFKRQAPGHPPSTSAPHSVTSSVQVTTAGSTTAGSITNEGHDTATENRIGPIHYPNVNMIAPRKPATGPLLYITGFFGAIFIVGPLLVRRGPNTELIKVCIMMTAFCMWIFWFTIYFGQMNPLIGPRLDNSTIAWMAHKLGEPVSEESHYTTPKSTTASKVKNITTTITTTTTKHTTHTTKPEPAHTPKP